MVPVKTSLVPIEDLLPSTLNHACTKGSLEIDTPVTSLAQESCQVEYRVWGLVLKHYSCIINLHGDYKKGSYYTAELYYLFRSHYYTKS